MSRLNLSLDDIERTAREWASEDAEWYPNVGPDVTLALIARIRDLEKIATRALGEWRAWHAEVDTSNAEAWKATEAEIEAMIRQVEAGVVRYGGWDADGKLDVDRVAEDDGPVLP